MVRALSGTACLLAAVLHATSASAQATPCSEDDEEVEDVVITGGVVSSARSQVQSITGVCGSRPVGVDLVGLPVTEVVVKNGRNSRRYTTNTTFVKDLAADVAAYSVRLNCPSFYAGLSVDIYSFVPTRCTYRVYDTRARFDETGALRDSTRQLRDDPQQADVMRALLTMDRRLWPYGGDPPKP